MEPEKHRVIGIRHVLRKFKDAGLIEEESLYATDAVANVQDELVRKALTWYQIGARRGAVEALNALLDGRLTVKRKAGKVYEIVAEVDSIVWKKRLKIASGNHMLSVPRRSFRIAIDDLGFE